MSSTEVILSANSTTQPLGRPFRRTRLSVEMIRLCLYRFVDGSRSLLLLIHGFGSLGMRLTAAFRFAASGWIYVRITPPACPLTLRAMSSAAATLNAAV